MAFPLIAKGQQPLAYVLVVSTVAKSGAGGSVSVEQFVIWHEKTIAFSQLCVVNAICQFWHSAFGVPTDLLKIWWLISNRITRNFCPVLVSDHFIFRIAQEKDWILRQSDLPLHSTASNVRTAGERHRLKKPYRQCHCHFNHCLFSDEGTVSLHPFPRWTCVGLPLGKHGSGLFKKRFLLFMHFNF